MRFNCFTTCYCQSGSSKVPEATAITTTTTTTTSATATTTITTTTTTPNQKCAAIKYKVLDSTSRSASPSQRTKYYCDSTDYGAQSPDWKGPGWYRFDKSK